MAVEKLKDPRTRREVTFVVGKVGGVFLNKLKNVVTYSGENGPWTPTHSVNLIVDGDKVSLGLTEKEDVGVKDADGKFHTLAKGMEVSVEVLETTEYKGTPQYGSRASKVTVLDTSGVVQGKAGGQGQQSVQRKPKDDTGVVAGNARTAAYNFIVANGKNGENVEPYIQFFAELAHNKRITYAKNNPEFDSYQVGVSVGQAITTAASTVSSLDDVSRFVEDYLSETIPMSIDIVKGLPKDEEVEVSVPGKPKAARKTPKPKPVDDSDMDDSLPF